MNEKDEWIYKRANEIQQKRKSKLEYAEYHGYMYYGSGDDCSHEEAEEEYRRMNPDEEEE